MLGSKELVAKLRGAPKVQRQLQQGQAAQRVAIATARRTQVQHSEGEQNDGGWTAAPNNNSHGGDAPGLPKHHPGHWLSGHQLSSHLSNHSLDRIH